MAISIEHAKAIYRAQYSSEPGIIVRAPGRVNLIGEHTDYNEGFVLPMAIEQETMLVAVHRNDRVLNCYAANFERAAQIDLDRPARNATEPWTDYLSGVVVELAKLGHPVTGADIVIIGDVPLGSGLSSSASLEMAALVLFESLGGFHLDGADAPKLGRRVENEFLGLKSGIMDQYVVRMAQTGQAVFLDCRSYEHELVPVSFSDATFVIANTRVSRGLTSSKYNERVEQCAEAVQVLNEQSGIARTHLRDFPLESLMKCKTDLSDVTYRRAKHVITENARTLEACESMKSGNASRMGELMNASHESLQNDYEVSCKELDAMVDIARTLPGCLGARMTGAGFGGCTVNLVALSQAEAFCETLLDQYKKTTGIDGDAIISSPGQGASRVQ